MQVLHRAPFVLTAVFTESTASVKYERWGQENVDCGQNQPTPNSEPSRATPGSRLAGYPVAARAAGHRRVRLVPQWCASGAVCQRLRLLALRTIMISPRMSVRVKISHRKVEWKS